MLRPIGTKSRRLSGHAILPIRGRRPSSHARGHSGHDHGDDDADAGPSQHPSPVHGEHDGCGDQRDGHHRQRAYQTPSVIHRLAHLVDLRVAQGDDLSDLIHRVIVGQVDPAVLQALVHPLHRRAEVQQHRLAVVVLDQGDELVVGGCVSSADSLRDRRALSLWRAIIRS